MGKAYHRHFAGVELSPVLAVFSKMEPVSRAYKSGTSQPMIKPASSTFGLHSTIST